MKRKDKHGFTFTNLFRETETKNKKRKNKLKKKCDKIKGNYLNFSKKIKLQFREKPNPENAKSKGKNERKHEKRNSSQLEIIKVPSLG